MPASAATKPELHRHLAILARRDPHIRKAIKEVGLPAPRHSKPGFAALAKIIVDQQVSIAAGAAIWKRLAGACGGKVNAQHIRDMSDSELRTCGLSAQKVRYVRGTADAVAARQLNFTKLDRADDDTVRGALTSLKGIGTWSADIYLLFALGRADVWPAADLGLQHGVRLLLGKRDKPSLDAMMDVAEAWRPYRSGAAVLLWHYYGASLKRKA